MSLSLIDQKHALRRQIRELEKQFPAEVRAKDSVRLCAQLRRQSIWREAQCILFFAPLPAEPDIRSLLEEALAAGRTVALPRFVEERGEYEVRQVLSLSELKLAHFGILEPGSDWPVMELKQLDFALVPGVAFDATGLRLGRGKGYFDRLLAEVRGHKCGVAFEWQVVPTVPVEKHDIGVNSLLTPSRWLRFLG
jgi:5-formyltetrahydrofolate cyclo-ligase